MNNNLNDAVMVTQVKELHAAMIADIFHPARHTDGLADFFFA